MWDLFVYLFAYFVLFALLSFSSYLVFVLGSCSPTQASVLVIAVLGAGCSPQFVPCVGCFCTRPDLHLATVRWSWCATLRRTLTLCIGSLQHGAVFCSGDRCRVCSACCVTCLFSVGFAAPFPSL